MVRVVIRTWGLAVLLALSGAACGGGAASTPTAPTATITPVPAPSTPTTVTLSGKITATVSGRPLADVTVSIDGYPPAKTDASGAFRFTVPNEVKTYRISASGSAIVSRDVYAKVSGNGSVAFDAIELADRFNQTFYAQLLRDGLEGTGREPLKRWTKNPMIYLRTVDDRGRAIGSATLAAIESVFSESAPLATGGKLRVAGYERGTGDRTGQAGWITVRFTSAGTWTYCGHADVGVEGGTIDFNLGGLPDGRTCRVCPSASEVDVNLIRHEFGHALGFYHVSDRGSAMTADWYNTCQTPFSAAEILHGSIAYSRPVGNLSPDADPESAASSAARLPGFGGQSAANSVSCAPSSGRSATLH